MNKKNIRSNFVKESLLDYDSLSKTLQENTTNIVRDLLNESVKATYKQILSESEEDEDEYEEEEVEDTESKDANEGKKSSKGSENEAFEDEPEEGAEFGGEEPVEGEAEEEIPAEEPAEGEEMPEEGADGEEWSDFEQYKVNDDEYDFSNAKDEDIVKVYKLLKDDDQVMVNVDNETNKVEIKDNQTGAEYIIDLGGDEEPLEEEEPLDANEGDLDYTQQNNMEESRIYEVALNEFDSHVGYTDDYQHDDVLTNDGMKETGNGNDWDAGVPRGTEKRWAGKKKAEAPFNGQSGKKVEESLEFETDDMTDEPMEESNLSQSRWNDTHAAHNRVPAANKDGYRRKGMQKTSKGTSYRENGGEGIEESKMITRVNKIMKENKALKSALSQFRTTLEEAAVTNYNLGQIVKLFSENSTTMDEKKEIISRFGKEATTLAESKKLYNAINGELQKKGKMNINEDRQFTANGSKLINETKIYQSNDVLNSLDLMSRICK